MEITPPVRKLLDAQDQAAGHDAVGGPPSIALGGAAAGQQVGPYVLLRRLGTGGMGEVWLARRADGGLQREVALKLPLSNPLPSDLAARFSLERDILARLEHPSIARLYDAGVSAEGQPYLAMEVVHGEPITAFSDGRRLDVEARIALFNQVLAAVQFAHANLVLHRDLKPSNILVTAEGHIHLLDFGIAKLLAGDAPAPQGTVTEWAGRVLTPAYASPEQVLGQPLSTASDVYTLGVVLFELLTGKAPYHVELSSVAQLELAIVQGDPLRLSATIDDDAAELRRTPRRKLARQLAGDLGTVVGKALAKRPGDRYGSAAALAEDLQRVLAKEPVQARPPSTVYRVSRFLGRHRWASLATGTAILALLGSTAVALRQAHRASVQGDLAQAEARNVSVVRDFLLEVLSAADPATAGAKPPGEVTVQEAVDAAASRMGTAVDMQPETKVPLLTTLSNVYSGLDQVDRSLALLDQALVAAERSGPTPNRMEAEVLAHLAGTNMFAGRSDAAARWLDRAEAAFAALGDTESEVYAQTLKIRGNLLRGGDRPPVPSLCWNGRRPCSGSAIRRATAESARCFISPTRSAPRTSQTVPKQSRTRRWRLPSRSLGPASSSPMHIRSVPRSATATAICPERRTTTVPRTRATCGASAPGTSSFSRTTVCSEPRCSSAASGARRRSTSSSPRPTRSPAPAEGAVPMRRR